MLSTYDWCWKALLSWIWLIHNPAKICLQFCKKDKIYRCELTEIFKSLQIFKFFITAVSKWFFSGTTTPLVDTCDLCDFNEFFSFLEVSLYKLNFISIEELFLPTFIIYFATKWSTYVITLNYINNNKPEITGFCPCTLIHWIACLDLCSQDIEIKFCENIV